ncbi:MAG: phosphate ABC transporter permease subunit PstC [Acidobacteriota bacterium]|jgi:phosphate transport system permease protein|nr:phosphate ABC transporter permease subunit PstC [Acidobacteriota bacterium]
MNESTDWRRIRDRIATQLIRVSAWLSIAVMFLILTFVAKEALPLFFDEASVAEAGWGKLFLSQDYGTPEAPLPHVWQPVSGEPKYSLVPLLIGTLKITVIAMLIATPLSIAAAVYTAEFASGRAREVLKPLVELLAGFPSVVLGFFALIVLASWLQDAFGFDYRLNAVVAGLALGLTVTPIIYTVCEDALSAVPRKLREASLALGATRAETTLRVVLPAAMPGIVAGATLGFGRAVGETMIVLMASGNAAIASWNFTDSARTLPATIAAELAEVVFGSPHYQVLFFIGLMLFLITAVLNGACSWLVGRLRSRLAGEA